jgi:nuclear pore complex protein Nup98-Nup96
MVGISVARSVPSCVFTDVEPDVCLCMSYQAFLDYVHIVTRLPELLEESDDNVAPDATTQSSEIDDLIRSVPRLISILPDVLSNSRDPRHSAALSVMIGGLVAQVDRVRPLALVSSIFAHEHRCN